jgi:hypothetical protein
MKGIRVFLRGAYKRHHNRKISSDPSLPKRGIIPPFGKGRAGGIFNVIPTHS